MRIHAHSKHDDFSKRLSLLCLLLLLLLLLHSLRRCRGLLLRLLLLLLLWWLLLLHGLLLITLDPQWVQECQARWFILLFSSFPSQCCVQELAHSPEISCPLWLNLMSWEPGICCSCCSFCGASKISSPKRFASREPATQNGIGMLQKSHIMMPLAATVQGLVNDQPTLNLLTKHIYQRITTAIGTLCDIFGPSSASWSSNIQVPYDTATVVLATTKRGVRQAVASTAASVQHHLPSVHTCKYCKLIHAYSLVQLSNSQWEATTCTFEVVRPNDTAMIEGEPAAVDCGQIRNRISLGFNRIEMDWTDSYRFH